MEEGNTAGGAGSNPSMVSSAIKLRTWRTAPFPAETGVFEYQLKNMAIIGGQAINGANQEQPMMQDQLQGSWLPMEVWQRKVA